MSAIKSDAKILGNINSDIHSFDLVHTNYQGINYRYVVSSEYDSTKPSILFIHGAIGSIDNFSDYTKSIGSDNTNIIILDRPNYGNDYNENYEHSIRFQSLLVNDLMDQYWSQESNIILGYSYGGPVALFAHMLRPYDSVITVSPAIDPENEVIPVLIYFYKWKLTRPLVPRAWVEASKEKLGHVDDLKLYENLWASVRGNIIHIHGEKDMIAPYENVKFLSEKISKEYYKHIALPQAGHGALWSQSDLILKLIKEQLA